MRVSTPSSNGTAILTPASQALIVNANNHIHVNSTGMEIPFTGVVATKNGVSVAAQQIRTSTPGSEQQLISNSWNSNTNSTFTDNMMNVQKHSSGMHEASSSAPSPGNSVSIRLTSPASSVNTGGMKLMTSMQQTGKVQQTNQQQNVGSPRSNPVNSMVSPTATAPVRLSSTQQVLVQRAPHPSSVQIPSGLTIPPGMVLARNQNGQLLLVNSNSLNNSSVMTTTSVPAVATPSSTVVCLKNSTGIISVAQTQVSALPVKTQVMGAVTQVTTAAVMGQAISRTVAPVTNTVKAVPGKPVVAASKSEISPGQSTTSGQSITLSQEDVVNVTKCRNFLTTLIKLASTGGQSPATVSNVKKLVQNLIDDKIEPEHFTQRLQIELNSAPQPYLVPFLKRSLPLLRLTMMQQSGGSGSVPPQVAAAALQASSAAAATSSTSSNQSPNQLKPVTAVSRRPVAKPKPVGKKQNTIPDIRLPRVSTSPLIPNQYQKLISPMPPSQSTNRTSTPSNSLSMPSQAAPTTPLRLSTQKWATASTGGGGGSGGTFKDDDDINDVASMAGVNLSEESARILATNSELVGSQVRSCEDSTIVNTAILTRRISEIVTKHPNIQQIGSEVIEFTAHAVEARIKDLIEKVTLVAFHRMGNFKEKEHYESAQDVKSQLKFLLQLDQLEKKRHAETEREVLMRAMKSRSKNEDPEQIRLKQRAKEMQQLELERMQIRNADETARNAIGPRRKKLKIDAAKPGLASETTGSFSSPVRSSTIRPRIKRVNVRDLIFVVEQEKDMSKSKLLYKSYLK